MSFPNIPNITPLISVTTAQVVPLLLASIALEELSLAHIMNAEAEKLQLALGTLTGSSVTFSPSTVSLTNLLDVDTSVQRTLRDVIKKEMLLEFKFENILDLIETLPCQPMIQLTLTALNPCRFLDIGTVTCSGQPISSPVTITFTIILNGEESGSATFTFRNGNRVGIILTFTVPFTGELTIIATTTVNGVTVSTTDTTFVNCPGPGVAGVDKGILLIEPYDTAQ